MNRKADLAKIHLAKKQLGMDDDTYRMMLQEMFGASSAGKLNSKQRFRLLCHMEERGAVFTRRNKPVQVSKQFYPIPDGPNASQKRYIAALWCKLGYNASGLDTRAEKQFGVDKFLWLDNQTALQKLAKDLINRCQKRGLDYSPDAME